MSDTRGFGWTQEAIAKAIMRAPSGVEDCSARELREWLDELASDICDHWYSEGLADGRKAISRCEFRCRLKAPPKEQRANLPSIGPFSGPGGPR